MNMLRTSAMLCGVAVVIATSPSVTAQFEPGKFMDDVRSHVAGQVGQVIQGGPGQHTRPSPPRPVEPNPPAPPTPVCPGNPGVNPVMPNPGPFPRPNPRPIPFPVYPISPNPPEVWPPVTTPGPWPPVTTPGLPDIGVPIVGPPVVGPPIVSPPIVGPPVPPVPQPGGSRPQVKALKFVVTTPAKIPTTEGGPIPDTTALYMGTSVNGVLVPTFGPVVVQGGTKVGDRWINCTYTSASHPIPGYGYVEAL